MSHHEETIERAREISRRGIPVVVTAGGALTFPVFVGVCVRCEIFLLPGEADVCRHCRDGRTNRDDPE